MNSSLSSSSHIRAVEIRPLSFILLIYFFICFPLSQVYFKNSSFLYKNWNLFFFIITLSILFSTRKLNLSKIGLSDFDKKHLVSGLALALLPVMVVFFLDTLIVKTGMAENDLFSGAELRKPTPFSSLDLLLGGLLSPAIGQLFITGFVLKILIKNDSLVIPGNGILYSLIHFDLGMGYLGLGMISAGLVRLTGTLVPAIAFSMGCSLAKILILTTYPRVTTVLVFLV